MATRLYFRYENATGVVPNAKQSADAITHDYAPSWATYATPAKMLTTAGSTSIANAAVLTEPKNQHYTHLGTFVSDPVYPGTISGTVTIALSVYESSGNVNMNPRVKIYKWLANDTFGSDILALTTSGTEAPTSVPTDPTVYFNVAITSTEFASGDRIVIEVESYDNNTRSTSFTQGMYYGNGTSGTYCSYIEFSQTFLFGIAPKLTQNLTYIVAPRLYVQRIVKTTGNWSTPDINQEITWVYGNGYRYEYADSASLATNTYQYRIKKVFEGATTYTDVIDVSYISTRSVERTTKSLKYIIPHTPNATTKTLKYIIPRTTHVHRGTGEDGLPLQYIIDRPHHLTLNYFLVERYYISWHYKNTLKINTPSNVVANYQIRCDITWKYGMETNFSDIRFTETNGTPTSDGTHLDYWVESKTDGVSAVVWVKVQSANQTAINLHYGCVFACWDWSTPTIFDFFDHFDGSSLDGSKWTSYNDTYGTITVSNSLLYMHAGASGGYPDPPWHLWLAGTAYVGAIPVFGEGYIIDFYTYDLEWESGYYSYTEYEYGVGANVAFSNTEKIVNYVERGQDPGNAGCNSTMLNVYYTMTHPAINHFGRYNAKSYHGYNYGNWYENTLTVPTGNLRPWIKLYSAGGSSQGSYDGTKSYTCEWARVRKFQYPEPTVTNISSQKRLNLTYYVKEDYNNNWSQHRTITIANPVDRVHYQHKMTLAYQPGMKSNFDDIRFSQNDDTQCDYCIDSKTDGVSAVVWIRVPSANQTTLRLHFGNASAVSQSNPDAVFEANDTFDVGELLLRWNTVSSTSPEPASYPYCVTNSYHSAPNALRMGEITGSGRTETRYVEKAITGTAPYGQYRLEFWEKYWHSNWNGGTYYLSVYVSGAQVWTGGGWTYFSNHDWTEHIITFNSAPTSIKLELYITNSWWYQYLEFDNVRVRKYTSPEPVLSIPPPQTKNVGGKTLSYKIRRERTVTAKQLKYLVKRTPTAAQKNLSYGIHKTTTTGLQLKYDIYGITIKSITPSLKYIIPHTQSPLTKSLKYVIPRTPSAITLSNQYMVFQRDTHSTDKQLRYMVKASKAAVVGGLQLEYSIGHNLFWNPGLEPPYLLYEPIESWMWQPWSWAGSNWSWGTNFAMTGYAGLQSTHYVSGIGEDDATKTELLQTIPVNFSSLGFHYRVDTYDCGDYIPKIYVIVTDRYNTEQTVATINLTGTTGWTKWEMDRDDMPVTWGQTTTVKFMTEIWICDHELNLQVSYDDFFAWEYFMYEETDTMTGTGVIVSDEPEMEMSSAMIGVGLLSDPEIEVTLDNVMDLMTSATFRRSMMDKMYTGIVTFDKDDFGLTSPFFKYFNMIIPDHNGTSRCVFCGMFPSQERTIDPGKNSESFTAKDDAWYLSNQYLDDSTLVLMTPADQLLITQHRLTYDHHVYYYDRVVEFEPGKIVKGATSGNWGKVIQHIINYGGAGWVILENCTGTIPEENPPNEYFLDNEALQTNGETIAYANGSAWDCTPDIVVVYPEDWVRKIVAGNSGYAWGWYHVTGIEPYRINPTHPSYVTWEVKDYTEHGFEPTDSKQVALDKMSDYYSFVALIKPRNDNGWWHSALWWVHQDDIDNADDYALTEHRGLSLPAKVTITNPDDYLVAPVTCNNEGEKKYNKVTVRCRDFDGNWWEAVKTTPALDMGEEKAREYPPENNENLTTQEECTARAEDLLDYYQNMVSTYNATFLKRTDFQLLQLLEFSGYTDQIPDGEYRIIDITYNYENGGVVNEVAVKLVPKDQFSAQLRLQRVFKSSVKTIRAIAKDELNKMGKPETGYVKAIDGNDITFVNDRGLIRHVSDGS